MTYRVQMYIAGAPAPADIAEDQMNEDLLRLFHADLRDPDREFWSIEHEDGSRDYVRLSAVVGFRIIPVELG